MTPTIPEILAGNAAALSSQAARDDAGDYLASRIGILATLSILAIQEVENGVAARVAENAAIRALFGEALAYDAELLGRLKDATAQTDHNLALSALDAANAELRRLLIALHEKVEAAPDGALEKKILGLYVEMARGRRLVLPGG